ncbi:response regulator [Deinococcus misasensis]|uniref:response regulator n=1 Tax=Deinococcus misasensis TaxID=392413 RepID=UPI000554480D|nr:response regulator [Deinococcus misasensis]
MTTTMTTLNPDPHAPSNSRILMFQHDLVESMMIRRFVNQLGYLVHEVAHPEDATEALSHEEGFGAILLDLGVKMDRAFQLLKSCREHFPNTPVIVVSSIRQEEVLEWLKRFGVQDVIVKPRSLRELLLRVENDLEKYAPLAS